MGPGDSENSRGRDANLAADDGSFCAAGRRSSSLVRLGQAREGGGRQTLAGDYARLSQSHRLCFALDYLLSDLGRIHLSAKLLIGVTKRNALHPFPPNISQ